MIPGAPGNASTSSPATKPVETKTRAVSMFESLSTVTAGSMTTGAPGETYEALPPLTPRLVTDDPAGRLTTTVSGSDDEAAADVPPW